MSREELLIIALRTTVRKWREGHSETAFRRWNRSYAEQRLAACADVLDAIIEAFEKAAPAAEIQRAEPKS